MDNFIAARSQMALSLAFHIIFSCIGMVMPFFMAVAHFRWIKTGNPLFKNITKAWSKGVAIFLPPERCLVLYYLLSSDYYSRDLWNMPDRYSELIITKNNLIFLY
jgi:hypothetical protein